MAVVNDQAENHIKIIQDFIGRAYTEGRPKDIFKHIFYLIWHRSNIILTKLLLK